MPSEPGRALLQLNGASGLPAHAVRRGKRWLSALLENSPVVPRRHRPTSAALGADASMCGWGALLFKDSGELWVAGGAWDREPRCISQGEANAASQALSSFAGAMPRNLHIFIGSAAEMNIMKKGNAHSDALVCGASLVDKALLRSKCSGLLDLHFLCREPRRRDFAWKQAWAAGVAKGTAWAGRQTLSRFSLLLVIDTGTAL
ncbi:hypothetical protein ERJ75_000741400 [Trypanosoma vivax]|nr:hypothetical protein ERJ75_000741400 [Trypanosoma vivax]